MFKQRKLVIATKHQKEEVIAPLMEQNFGLTCCLAMDLDTDTLGTFTGEIERRLSPLEAAKQKCLLAMEATGCDLAIASEGSFGPHPSFFFVPADDECLLFIDKKHDLSVFVREISSDTNFFGKEIRTESELIQLAEKAKFPSHALILRKSQHDNNDIIKGIRDWDLLKSCFHQLIAKYGKAYLESDMRAMYNPTRMKIIEKATQKLVNKLHSLCPKCNTPAFGVEDVKRGLPCNLCGMPTKSILSHIYICKKCNYTKEEIYPNQKLTEEPTFCDFCNP